MKKNWIVVLLLAMILSGCCNVDTQTPGSPQLVTGIDVVYRKGAIKLERQYSTGEKMREILNYLRLLKTYGPADVDPTVTDAGSTRITLFFSDGTEKVYEQYADQFLRFDGGPWEYIDPEQGQELGLLLGLTQSD